MSIPSHPPGLALGFPLSGASILIVDDLAENLLIARKFLEVEGYRVRTADSGADALEAIAQDPPELVLLDVMMPNMDGLETCRRIKAATRDLLPVILITAHSSPNIKRAGLEAGAEDFVSKPFDREELVARIRSHLRTKRLYDDLRESYRYIEDEVQAVAALQRSLLPERTPELPGVSIYSSYAPSRRAGGDYFDFFPVGQNQIGIAVADVSGHGPQAAVVMAMTKVVLNMLEGNWAAPSALLTNANRSLHRFLSGDFITMFYGVLDARARRLRYSLAGHCPPLRFGAHAKPEPLSIQSSLPLGVEPGEEFHEAEVSFNTGDRLLIHTDGIIEVQNDQRQILGTEGLIELIQQFSELRPMELGEQIVRGAEAFSNRRAFRDDCTMLLLEFHS